MRKYKVLFADDRPEQFEAFRDAGLSELAKHGIVFDPLDYSPSYHPAREPQGDSVRERLAKADEEAPYDIVISDLNFQPAGGAGETDGVKILKKAREHCATTKLALITAFSKGIDGRAAVELSRSTGLTEDAWMDLQNSSSDWTNVAGMCRLLCDAIDAERLAAAARAVPDLYEIAVLEDVDDDRDVTARLRLRIGEKKTANQPM